MAYDFRVDRNYFAHIESVVAEAIGDDEEHRMHFPDAPFTALENIDPAVTECICIVDDNRVFWLCGDVIHTHVFIPEGGVTHAVWAVFESTSALQSTRSPHSRANVMKSGDGSDSSGRCLIVVADNSLTIVDINGEVLDVPTPFPIESIFTLPCGILVQRRIEPSPSAAKDAVSGGAISEAGPVFFTLSHPLEELRPVAYLRKEADTLMSSSLHGSRFDAAMSGTPGSSIRMIDDQKRRSISGSEKSALVIDTKLHVLYTDSEVPIIVVYSEHHSHIACYRLRRAQYADEDTFDGKLSMPRSNSNGADISNAGRLQAALSPSGRSASPHMDSYRGRERDTLSRSSSVTTPFEELQRDLMQSPASADGEQTLRSSRGTASATQVLFGETHSKIGAAVVDESSPAGVKGSHGFPSCTGQSSLRGSPTSSPDTLVDHLAPQIELEELFTIKLFQEQTKLGWRNKAGPPHPRSRILFFDDELERPMFGVFHGDVGRLDAFRLAHTHNGDITEFPAEPVGMKVCRTSLQAASFSSGLFDRPNHYIYPVFEFSLDNVVDACSVVGFVRGGCVRSSSLQTYNWNRSLRVSAHLHDLAVLTTRGDVGVYAGKRMVYSVAGLSAASAPSLVVGDAPAPVDLDSSARSGDDEDVLLISPSNSATKSHDTSGFRPTPSAIAGSRILCIGRWLAVRTASLTDALFRVHSRIYTDSAATAILFRGLYHSPSLSGSVYWEVRRCWETAMSMSSGVPVDPFSMLLAMLLRVTDANVLAVFQQVNARECGGAWKELIGALELASSAEMDEAMDRLETLLDAPTFLKVFRMLHLVHEELSLHKSTPRSALCYFEVSMYYISLRSQKVKYAHYYFALQPVVSTTNWPQLAGHGIDDDAPPVILEHLSNVLKGHGGTEPFPIVPVACELTRLCCLYYDCLFNWPALPQVYTGICENQDRLKASCMGAATGAEPGLFEMLTGDIDAVNEPAVNWVMCSVYARSQTRFDTKSGDNEIEELGASALLRPGKLGSSQTDLRFGTPLSVVSSSTDRGSPSMLFQDSLLDMTILGRSRVAQSTTWGLDSTMRNDSGDIELTMLVPRGSTPVIDPTTPIGQLKKSLFGPTGLQSAVALPYSSCGSSKWSMLHPCDPSLAMYRRLGDAHVWSVRNWHAARVAIPTDGHEGILLSMTMERWTVDDVKQLPDVISMILDTALCSNRSKSFAASTAQPQKAGYSEWPPEAFWIIGRPDLSYSTGGKYPSTAHDTTLSRKDAKTMLDVAVGRRGNKDAKSGPAADVDAMADDGTCVDDAVTRLLFAVDRRISEVRSMLRCTEPVRLMDPSAGIANRGGGDGAANTAESQVQLQHHAQRLLSSPIGRGIFGFATGTLTSVTTVHIPPLVVSGLLPPNEAVISLDQAHAVPNEWARFHNAVAAGLRASFASHDNSQVTRTWIVRARAQGIADGWERGGFLLALGFLGELDSLSIMDIYKFLSQQQEGVSVGLLLGLCVSKRGTMHQTITRMLSLHVASLLPPHTEREIPMSVQSAAVFGLGLVYQGTGQRFIADMLLNEMIRQPADDHLAERHSYALSAGLGLGFVLLGRGGSTKDELSGNMEIVNQLLAIVAGVGVAHKDQIFQMTGVHAAGGSAKERGDHATAAAATAAANGNDESNRVLEAHGLNSAVCGPGAVLALGLMFLRSGNAVVANMLKLPDTEFLLDFVHTDMMLLRVLISSLIMWDETVPAVAWIKSHVPKAVLTSLSSAALDLYGLTEDQTAATDSESAKKGSGEQRPQSTSMVSGDGAAPAASTDDGSVDGEPKSEGAAEGDDNDSDSESESEASDDSSVEDERLRAAKALYEAADLQASWPDLQLLNQSLVSTLTGCAMALGIKYAGHGLSTASGERAWKALHRMLDAFIRLRSRVPLSASSADVNMALQDLHRNFRKSSGRNDGLLGLDRPFVERCIGVVALSLSLVVAGSGDLGTLKILRYLYHRSDSDLGYGNYMAISMAIGILFAGGGQVTVRNDIASVGMLLASLYPVFPLSAGATQTAESTPAGQHGVVDTVYHLQAFRHLIVTTMGSQCLDVRDADSSECCYVPVDIVLDSPAGDGSTCLSVLAPCLLPPLHMIQSVSVRSNRYWPLTLLPRQNVAHRALLEGRFDHGGRVVLFIKRRDGYQAYANDPLGLYSVPEQPPLAILGVPKTVDTLPEDLMRFLTARMSALGVSETALSADDSARTPRTLSVRSYALNSLRGFVAHRGPPSLVDYQNDMLLAVLGHSGVSASWSGDDDRIPLLHRCLSKYSVERMIHYSELWRTVERICGHACGVTDIVLLRQLRSLAQSTAVRSSSWFDRDILRMIESHVSRVLRTRMTRAMQMLSEHTTARIDIATVDDILPTLGVVLNSRADVSQAGKEELLAAVQDVYKCVLWDAA